MSIKIRQSNKDILKRGKCQQNSDTFTLLTHIFIHECTHAGRTVQKKDRLAGLCSDIQAFSLQGEVIVIGMPFKASASLRRIISKLTALAGFLLAKFTGRFSPLRYATTNSDFRAALNVLFLYP